MFSETPNYYPRVRALTEKVISFLEKRPVLYEKAQRLANWYVSTWGHRKYGISSSLYLLGLLVDDIIDTNHPVVMEAISRLSDQQQFDRNFRIRRAIHLHMKHEFLPKEEWTKPEEDQKYLWPIIEKICKERDERTLLDKLSSNSDMRSQIKSFLEKDSSK